MSKGIVTQHETICFICGPAGRSRTSLDFRNSRKRTVRERRIESSGM